MAPINVLADVDRPVIFAVLAAVIYVAYNYLKSDKLRDFPLAPSVPVLGTLPFLSDFKNTCLKWTNKYGPFFRVRFGQSEEFLLCTTAAGYDRLLESDASLSLRPRLPFFSRELELKDEWLPLQDSDTHVIAQRKALGAGVRQAFDFTPDSGIERSSQALLHSLSARPGHAWKNKELIDNFQEAFAVLGIALSYGLRWTLDDVKANPAATDMVHGVTEILAMLDMPSEITFVIPALVTLLPWRAERLRERARKVRQKIFVSRTILYKHALDSVDANGLDSLEPSTLKSILANDDSSSSLSENDRQLAIASAFAGSVDTSSHMLAVIVACLAAFPEWQRIIREETQQHWQGTGSPPKDVIDKVKSARAFVKEVMRVYPIIDGTLRSSDKELSIDGRIIPPHSVILVHFGLINTDQGIFGPDALKFNPGRWIDTTPKFHVYGHVSFGIGRRSCPGSQLAELILVLSTCRLAWNFDIGFTGKGPSGPASLATESDGVLQIQSHRPITFTPIKR